MAILTTCTSTFVDLNEINIGDVAPSSPSNNELWFSTTENVVYKWDDSVKQWIVVNDYTEDIKDAIAGIEVNARNLLYDTDAAIDIVTNNTEIKTVKLHELVNSLDYTKHIKGNKITFAFDWEFMGTNPMGSFYIQTNGPQYTKLSNQISVSNDNYYGTEKLTVNLTSDSTFNSTSIVCTHNNGTIRIMHCRLLFGDKDLGWTQAPEDLVSKFETIFNRTAKGIYMQASGNGQTSLVDVTNQEVKIKSNNINIEGYTTINEHFKILPSGDLEAVNAKFSGTVDAFNISGATITGSVLTTGANFNVDSTGLLTAKNGKFSGSISASDITGSTFTSTNSKFKVLADGTIEATNGNFTGNINTGSNITGASIVGSSIRNASNTFTVSSEGVITGASVKGGTIGIGNGTSYNAFTVDTDGNVAIAKGSINIGSGAFAVTNTGALSATNANITGNINSGSVITGASIVGSTISTTSGKFTVDSNGVLTATEAVITGKITAGTGSTVGAAFLTGTIDNSRLNSTITAGATNGTTAQTTLNSKAGGWDTTKTTVDTKASGWDTTKSTVDSNSTNWINAYNRVVQWAYGAVTGTTTIDGGLIQTNTILADKIAVADFSNYATLKPNVDSVGGPNGGTWSSYNITSTLLNHTPFTNKINNVKEGDRFRITGWIWCATAAQGIAFNIGMRKSDGTYLSGVDAICKVSKASTYEQFSLELTVPAIPTGFSYMTIKSYLTSETCPVWLYGVGIYRMANGELIVDGAIDGKTITGATLKGGTIGIGGTAYDAFTVDNIGNVTIKKGSIDINNGAFSVSDTGVLRATGAVITGTITAGAGSNVASTYLTGTIDNARLNSTITTGATNGTTAQGTLNTKAGGWDSTKSTVDAKASGWDSAKSTVDSNSTNWSNAYNRVLEWANGAITGTTTINGGLIETNTITAKQIAIGDFNNYSQLAKGKNLSNRYGVATWVENTSNNSYWQSSNSYFPFTINETNNPFKAGDKVQIRFDACTVTSRSVSVGIWFYSDAAASTNLGNIATLVSCTPTWGTKTVNLTLPEGNTYVQSAKSVAILISNGSTGEVIQVRNVFIARQVTGELIVDGAIDGKTITGATLKGGTIGIGGTAYDAFTVDTDGNVTIKKGSIDINSGAFSVSDTGALRATSAVITGTITAGAGSTVPSTYLTGTIDNARLNSTITTGATNGTAAQTTLNSKASGWDSTKSTMDSNSTNWINAYNRVVQWAYGAVTGSTTIDGGLIQTNTILANKIAIGDFSNYCELTPTNCTSYGFTKVADASASNNPWLQLNTLTRDTSLCSANSYEAYTGNVVGTYRVEFEVSSNVTGASTSGGTGGTYMGINVGLYSKTNTGGNSWYFGTGVTSSSAATATKVSSIVSLPSNIVAFGVYLQIGGYPPFAGTCKIRNVRITKMMTGELIVDGAIDGQTITGATLKGGTIGIGGTAYNAFTVDNIGNVNISKGSISINNGAFSVTDKGVLTATSANIIGNINSGSTITGATIKNASNTFSVSPDGVITGASISASAISTTSGNFTVNNSGILTAKGAIITGTVTITAGSVPDNVLSSTVTSGAANGSSALNGLNNLDIGGRNLARSTSSIFSNPYTSFSGITNTCPSLANIYTDGLSVGDTVTVKLVYSYTNIVAATGQTAQCWIQGSGNSTGWNSGAYYTSPRKTLSGSGEYTFLYSFTVTADHLLNDYWSTSIRHDYVQSGTVQWRSFKVEKGNKPTDWTPAPEDLLDSLADSEKAINDNIDSAIGNVKDDVLQSVGDNYTPLDDFNALNLSVSSKFTQTAKDISATFTTVNNYAKTVDGKLQDFQDTVESYIKFSANGIDLGKTNNPFTATLDNTQLAFKQNGNVVAYINNNKMVITTADIDDQLRIGDPTNGYFVWTQGGNGNLTLKWSDK